VTVVDEAIAATLARIAASADPLPVRGATMLAALRTAVPFDAAWLGAVDRDGAGCVCLASIDVDDAAAELLAERAAAGGREDHSRGERHPSSWPDRVDVVGYRTSLVVDLMARGGRRVGAIALLHRRTEPPTHTRRRLAELAPVLALGVDPMRSLVATAHMVQGVEAGTVLHDDGSTEPLPGLSGNPLLEAGSVPVAIARRHLAEGVRYTSFLWPLGGPHAPDGHGRITVMAPSVDLPTGLVGLVVVSRVGDLCGLTPRELEVMGLVVDGRANREIARTLVVSPRTVAAHLEHVLTKLDATSRTQAAVRAERAGLYVPAGRGPQVGCTPRPASELGSSVAPRTGERRSSTGRPRRVPLSPAAGRSAPGARGRVSATGLSRLLPAPAVLGR